MSEHRLLMIPGPIELEPSVLAAMGQRATSHVDPDFVSVFGRALGALRKRSSAAVAGEGP